MIRPSPTSISLSANDLSTHLQQIEIYHGLLKEGFKKKDIQRYFREQREVTESEDQQIDSHTELRAPTWVEIACQPRFVTTNVDHHQPTLVSYASGPVQSTECSSPAETDGRKGDDAKPPLPFVVFSSRSFSTSDDGDVLLQGDKKQRITSSASVILGHAPRKSSLLRFASTLPSDEQETSDPLTLIPFSSRVELKYRPRSNTYSYDQSEADEDISNDSSLNSALDHLTLDESLVPPTFSNIGRSLLRGDAEEFTPISRPQNSSTFFDARCCTSESLSGPAIDLEWQTDAVDNTRIVPTLQRRVARPPSLTGVVRNSTSPPDIAAAIWETTPQPSSPTLPPMPVTPQHLTRSPIVRTEPRETRSRYLDGQSFTPYNDSLPASLQPQTPAELNRQPLINEINAVYTAPPGTLHNVRADNILEHRANPESTAESPTNIAISIRHRRNREYARSARIEGLRIIRQRSRFGVDGNTGHRVPRQVFDAWTGEEQLSLWRDDLDADRVGEENFEEAQGAVEMTDAGVRVVSGNRRAPAL